MQVILGDGGDEGDLPHFFTKQIQPNGLKVSKSHLYHPNHLHHPISG